ncbi:MAG: DUF4315 family protein [Mobilitalea sp.]
MNGKIEKLQAEQEKNKEKIARMLERNKEIATQITELENLDILGLVKEKKLNLKQLAELFQEMKHNPVIPMHTEEKEETHHEEK